jgi:hypothetical protein
MMGFPKPEPPRKVKARRGRLESKVAQAVRASVALRDGDCRLGDPLLWDTFGECRGESEWAHLGKFRRFVTRGMPPERRHTSVGSLMLCTGHHDRYDGRAPRRIDIQALSSAGADGRLVVKCGDRIYLEPAR